MDNSLYPKHSIHALPLSNGALKKKHPHPYQSIRWGNFHCSSIVSIISSIAATIDLGFIIKKNPTAEGAVGSYLWD